MQTDRGLHRMLTDDGLLAPEVTLAEGIGLVLELVP